MSRLSWRQLRLLSAVVACILGLSCIYYTLPVASPWDNNKSYDVGHSKIPIFASAKSFAQDAYLDPSRQSQEYGSLVIAAHNTTDLSWLEDVASIWNILAYNTSNIDHADPRLRLPASKGREAMVYLTYIIDNYDALPLYSIFVHGHREAWHQEVDITYLISSLKREAVAREGYISLRCEWYPSCPAEMQAGLHDALVSGGRVLPKSTEAALAGNWRVLFPDRKQPEVLASPCCAQFAVTDKAIRSRPREDYEHFQRWLLENLLEDEVSGRVMEKLWAYIFTGKAVHCPPPEQCACEYFGRCSSSNHQ